MAGHSTHFSHFHYSAIGPRAHPSNVVSAPDLEREKQEKYKKMTFPYIVDL
jgi:hypothetical protein